MYLFIDNCSLLRLVHSDAYSNYLTKLTNLIKDGHIKLITHKLILEEWEKHKAIDKEKKLKKLNKLHGNAQDPTTLLPSYINVDHIDIQQSVLDKLLRDAIVIDTPDTINNEFAERFRKRLAPFHNKKDSQNDWEAFGSIAHHCNVNSIPYLYFVSSNDGEFADPLEKQYVCFPEIGPIKNRKKDTIFN